MTAVINVLFMRVADGLVLALTVAGVGAGLGIASEKRWGYYLAAATSAVWLYPPLRIVLSEGITAVFNFELIVYSIWPGVLLILLMHPQSREYQRIWFQ